MPTRETEQQQEHRRQYAHERLRHQNDRLLHGLLHDPFGLIRNMMADQKRGPRRCAYQIQDWKAVTGEIFAMRDPMQNLMHGLDSGAILMRWPWNSPRSQRGG